MSIEKGDIVILKSGGPRMTVTGIIGKDKNLDILKINGFEDGDITVEYFDDSNTLVRNTFKQSSLNIKKD